MGKNIKTGRNDLCACGSGKKFKKCCAAKVQQRSRFTMAVIVLVVSAVVGAIAYSISSVGDDSGSMTPTAGKVWSPEHGHWH
jgi:hypothetical protein